MAVYSYVRVSTARQADVGESLTAQRRMIEGYAQMIGVGIDRHFAEEGVSGSVPLQERPQGGELLSLLEAGDLIITTKLDRCFRSARDALNVLDDLKRRGVSLHMLDLGGDVTGNGVSKLVFTILSAVAEVERDRTRERIKEVKSDQRKRGQYLGGSRPFGFDVVDDHLVRREDEQATLAYIFKARRAGQSLDKIVAGVRRRGHRLSKGGVDKILRREGVEKGAKQARKGEKRSPGG